MCVGPGVSVCVCESLCKKEAGMTALCVYSICIVCMSTWKCSAYESNALQTKRALFLSNTLTDVYKEGIYMLGGGLTVIPINSFSWLSKRPQNNDCYT